MPTSPLNRARRLRPAAPSCRGGASSMLRLSATPAASGDRAAWLQRMALTLSVAPPGLRHGPGDEDTIGLASIVTPLLPSPSLARVLAR